jgi:hypothetical protein
MPDLKKHYDRYLLAAAGLVLAGAAILLALASGAAKEAAVMPPASSRQEPFAANEEFEILKLDRAEMDQRRAWSEAANGASTFVSRIYLLKDDRLIDIEESGNDLFPGIPNKWITENNLDYSDASLPERDPDGDNFTNFEEFTAKTNPRDPASKPDEWTKLRLVSVQQQILESVLTSLVTKPVKLSVGTTAKGALRIEVSAEGVYDNPPDDTDRKSRSNPPSFLGKSVQVRFGPGDFANAKVTSENIEEKSRKFSFAAELETKNISPQAAARIAAASSFRAPEIASLLASTSPERAFEITEAIMLAVPDKAAEVASRVAMLVPDQSAAIKGLLTAAEEGLSKQDKTTRLSVVEVAVGAWINSQSADEPGKVKGQSAQYVIGQLLYINEFLPGLATPRAKPTPFILFGVMREERPAPKLGINEKMEAEIALLAGVAGPSKTTELEKNVATPSPYALAGFVDTRPGGAAFQVATGESFPPGDTPAYKLVDVSDENATIEVLANSERHKIPKAPAAAPENAEFKSNEAP